MRRQESKNNASAPYKISHSEEGIKAISDTDSEIDDGELNSRSTRRKFLRRLGRLSVGVAATGAGSYLYGNRIESQWLSVERVRVPIPHLPTGAEGFKIVQMSDFHLYPHTTIDLIRKAVEYANALKPDLVVLTGDYVYTRADSIHELAPALARLNATQGVFSILGNHDLWTNAHVVQAGLEQAGLPVLNNRGVTIGGKQARFYLAGLADGWSGQPDLNAALTDRPSSLPVVLLMHEPDFADRFAYTGRVAVQLSGHSHGGQVRLPGIGALRLPPYGRKYDQGLYRVGAIWVYTTRGIGVVGPPTRLNCRPEITEITLVGA